MGNVFVMALHWDDLHKEQNEHIIGEFDKFYNAEIFARAYEKEFHSQTRIRTEYELLNRKD